MPEPLLDVRDLSVAYRTDAGDIVAVDRVTFEMARSEFLAVVGESGCGKSTLLYAITQLLSPPAEVIGGSVRFQGRDLVGLDGGSLRRLRWREFSIVMQSAMNALNPTLSIEDQFGDAMRAHEPASAAAVRASTEDVLRLVGIDPVHRRSYPHQLSGGMRQRAMVAMALLFEPDLIVMDEPTSALDVVAQRALMGQIKELQVRLGFAVLFVTHDMSLVSHYSDRMLVMYAGQVAEIAPTTVCFDRPLHPYSQGLFAAFPSIRGPKTTLTGIPGSPPDLLTPPTGCRFHPRCPLVMPHCSSVEPALIEVDGADVRCLLYAPNQGRPAASSSAASSPASSRNAPEGEASA